MGDEQDVKIAVVEEQIKGLREQQKTHADRTEAMLTAQNIAAEGKFTKLFEYIKPVVDFTVENKELPKKVAILWDERNKQTGFLSFGKLITGAVGGVIALAAEWFIGEHR